MLGNNPSYIVPREILDFKTSFEMIEEITSLYISEQKKNPNSNLEIEIKTGYSFLGRDQFSDSYKHILYTLSHRDFLIVGLRSPKANTQSYFGFKDYVGDTYHLTKDKLSKKRFLDVKTFFEKENNLYPDKIKTSKTEFSVDFAMADGSRVTYDVINQNWKRIRKNEKTSIDILHKSYTYRIGYAFEENLEFNEEEFRKMKVNNIRIKDRKSYQLEYMEYSFTEVAAFVDTGRNLDEMKESFLDSKKRGDEALGWYSEVHLRMQEEYEIEVEVIDKGPFNGTLGRPEFSSYLKRFIRNAEGLFLVPQVLNEEISQKYLGNQQFVMPRIGQYYSEYYLEKLKKKDERD